MRVASTMPANDASKAVYGASERSLREDGGYEAAKRDGERRMTDEGRRMRNM